MKQKRLPLILTGLVLLVLSVGAVFLVPRLESQRRVLETSDSFMLLSLEPFSSDRTGEMFHRNHKVLGKLQVTDEVLKQQLVAALYKGIEVGSSGQVACHNPRHGIRAIKGNRKIEVSICFECLNIYFYENEKKGGVQSTSSYAEKLFNQVLRQAKVRLSPKRPMNSALNFPIRDTCLSGCSEDSTVSGSSKRVL